MSKVKFTSIILLCLFIFFLILCFFLKLDLVTTGIIYHDNYAAYVVMDQKSYDYLENNGLDHICVNHDNKKAYAKIKFSEFHDGFFIYQIYLPPNFLLDTVPVESPVILDQVNIYEFLFYNL